MCLEYSNTYLMTETLWPEKGVVDSCRVMFNSHVFLVFFLGFFLLPTHVKPSRIFSKFNLFFIQLFFHPQISSINALILPITFHKKIHPIWNCMYRACMGRVCMGVCMRNYFLTTLYKNLENIISITYIFKLIYLNIHIIIMKNVFSYVLFDCHSYITKLLMLLRHSQ